MHTNYMYMINEDYIVHAHAVILMLVTFIFVTNCLQSLNISFTVLILTMKRLTATRFSILDANALSSRVPLFTGVAPPPITR